MKMMDQFKEKKEEKVRNIIQRIAEIDLKMLKLQQTKDQLYLDLKRNQELQVTGPKVPTPKIVEISEEQKQQILENVKVEPTQRKMTAF